MKEGLSRSKNTTIKGVNPAGGSIKEFVHLGHLVNTITAVRLKSVESLAMGHTSVG